MLQILSRQDELNKYMNVKFYIIIKIDKLIDMKWKIISNLRFIYFK